MPRPRKDTSYLENIPIIKDFLIDNCPLNKKQQRRYILDLAVMYPYILSEFGTFDNFLKLNKNQKAKFFNDFAQREITTRINKYPQKDKINIEARIWQVVWDVQGFLGYLSIDRDLRANHKWLTRISSKISVINPINILDVYDLYEVLPDFGRRRLSLQMFCGWNNIDLVGIAFDDFQPYDMGFSYIKKTRKKTAKKQVTFLNVFGRNVMFEIERFANRHDIKSNQPLFPIQPRSVTALYKVYLKKNKLNEKTIPMHIRQLCTTKLEPVFRDDPDLLDLWSQHALKSITKKHYVKNYINRMILKYDDICKGVWIPTAKYATLELNQMKEDIATKLDLQSTQLANLEKKFEEKENEKNNEIKDLLKVILKKVDKS